MVLGWVWEFGSGRSLSRHWCNMSQDMSLMPRLGQGYKEREVALSVIEQLRANALAALRSILASIRLGKRPLPRAINHTGYTRDATLALNFYLLESAADHRTSTAPPIHSHWDTHQLASPGQRLYSWAPTPLICASPWPLDVSLFDSGERCRCKVAHAASAPTRSATRRRKSPRNARGADPRSTAASPARWLTGKLDTKAGAR